MAVFVLFSYQIIYSFHGIQRFKDRSQEKNWSKSFPEYLKRVLFFTSLKEEHEYNLPHWVVVRITLNNAYRALSTEPST